MGDLFAFLFYIIPNSNIPTKCKFTITYKTTQ